MSNTRIYWLHALSPTHAGIGRGVGYIDLPIDRDGVTGWPIIRSSAFKGVWRDWAVQQDLSNIEFAFGRPDKDGEVANSGSLIPTDAKLVCLPVRSFRGTFAWCTSSLCLQMLRRTLVLTGAANAHEIELLKDVPTPKEPDDKTDQPGEAYCLGETLVETGRVYLEDLDFKAITSDKLTGEWGKFIARSVFPGDEAWQEQFQKRFVVLPDSAFDFLCDTGTEVHTRVRISDETKTVEAGALWTEESLPAETILAGILRCDRVFGRNGEEVTPTGLLNQFANDSLTLQIGGKATIGRGQMRCVFTQVNRGGK